MEWYASETGCVDKRPSVRGSEEHKENAAVGGSSGERQNWFAFAAAARGLYDWPGR